MTPEEMVTATFERHTLLEAVSRLPDNRGPLWSCAWLD